MKIKYDPKVDALYICLAKGKYFSSMKASDNILVDKNSRGNVLGIEVLEAKKSIPAFNPKETNFTYQVV